MEDLNREFIPHPNYNCHCHWFSVPLLCGNRANAQIAALEAKLASMQNSPFAGLEIPSSSGGNGSGAGSSRAGSSEREDEMDFEEGFKELLEDAKAKDKRREEGGGDGNEDEEMDIGEDEVVLKESVEQSKVAEKPEGSTSITKATVTQMDKAAAPPPPPTAQSKLHSSLPARPSKATLTQAKTMMEQDEKQQKREKEKRDYGVHARGVRKWCAVKISVWDTVL